MPAPSQNMAESAKAKPNTIEFCGKMVVCNKTPCTNNATPSNTRPIVLMPDAFDARQRWLDGRVAMRAPAGYGKSAVEKRSEGIQYNIHVRSLHQALKPRRLPPL